MKRPRLSIPTANMEIKRPDRWHLALTFFRLGIRREEQLKLRLREAKGE